jgi:hypothetical protein
MLHTVKVIVGGVALLALCLLIGHWVGGPTPAVGLVKAVKVFVPLWLVAAGINMRKGTLVPWRARTMIHHPCAAGRFARGLSAVR